MSDFTTNLIVYPKILGTTEIPFRGHARSKAAFCRNLIKGLVPGKATILEFSDHLTMEHYRSVMYSVTTQKKWDTCGLQVSSQRDGLKLLIWLRIGEDAPKVLEASHG